MMSQAGMAGLKEACDLRLRCSALAVNCYLLLQAVQAQENVLVDHV